MTYFVGPHSSPHVCTSFILNSAELAADRVRFGQPPLPRNEATVAEPKGTSPAYRRGVGPRHHERGGALTVAHKPSFKWESWEDGQIRRHVIMYHNGYTNLLDLFAHERARY
jgi:hypothetical protein